MATTDRRGLRASDADLRALLDAITDCAISLLDRDGRMSTWSAGAEAITGYREDEVLGPLEWTGSRCRWGVRPS